MGGRTTRASSTWSTASPWRIPRTRSGCSAPAPSSTISTSISGGGAAEGKGRLRIVLELVGNLFLREAWRAVARNRLRSVLAALAIMIGVAAVVCVVAIGRAGSRRAEQQLQNLGENFVWIEAGSRAPSGVRTGSHGTTRLILADAEAVARNPLIKWMPPKGEGSPPVAPRGGNGPPPGGGGDVPSFEI